jgi:hypothetical protein
MALGDCAARVVVSQNPSIPKRNTAMVQLQTLNEKVCVHRNSIVAVLGLMVLFGIAGSPAAVADPKGVVILTSPVNGGHYPRPGATSDPLIFSGTSYAKDLSQARVDVSFSGFDWIPVGGGLVTNRNWSFDIYDSPTLLYGPCEFAVDYSDPKNKVFRSWQVFIYLDVQ